MGSSCVRDCERSAHEYAVEAEVRPLGLRSEESILNSSLSSHLLFQDQSKVAKAHGKGNGLGGIGEHGGGMAVPPVPNWFQALRRQDTNDAGAPMESPRFDEVTTARDTAGVFDDGKLSARPQVFNTPRGGASVAGEFTHRTPGPSPRDSPRDDTGGAGGGGKPEELSYEGTYLGSLKHGSGRLRMQGCTYDGNFRNDAKHGNGVLTWDDGRQYRGQFEAGKFHGSAVMTWPDGRKYCGQYLEDRKHGDGTFSWQDGRRYQGQWVVGKRHGVGVYTNAKGITRTGMWQMDRPLHWDVPATSPAPSQSHASNGSSGLLASGVFSAPRLSTQLPITLLGSQEDSSSALPVTPEVQPEQTEPAGARRPASSEREPVQQGPPILPEKIAELSPSGPSLSPAPPIIRVEERGPDVSASMPPDLKTTPERQEQKPEETPKPPTLTEEATGPGGAASQSEEKVAAAPVDGQSDEKSSGAATEAAPSAAPAPTAAPVDAEAPADREPEVKQADDAAKTIPEPSAKQDHDEQALPTPRNGVDEA
eukprot:TRINITY_DN12179_c0_g1_i1.p1 TRINITY_DN12179_c0_g1~~TRINITY_DN12179_c0_g1_i1.p1  ORF type:complete len:535 (-),score=93.75 TRINITY_DN12179_c0_g1_i1:165-1769(-)